MAFNRLRRDKKRNIVIVDSSALMIPFETSIDLNVELTRLLGRYQGLIPEPIIKELKYLLDHGRERQRNLAKAALKYAERYFKVEKMDTMKGDDAVFQLAVKFNASVISNDKALKKRLNEVSLQTIYIRGKNRLELK